MIRKYYQEPYRPLFHYTSQSNIINDPNGLVWHAGEYHLFHQYNVNNHIHWGHAVSADLVHWQHLPPALFPDSIGQIWSGSAVVDTHNSAGFQQGDEPAMVALFTYNEHVDAQQSQGLAYSTDRGRTWTMYQENPVLTGRGQKDFRDPKVFWDTQRNRWAMILACGNHVEFYVSNNLKTWQFTGTFGEGIWEGTWECSDLFEMPVEGAPNETAWVLITSMNNGSPAGGTGMRYFIGQFDGNSFIPFHAETPWLDMGKDFYAGVTWNNIPETDGRRLMIGWADNWRYRDYLPTAPFLGQFSCVRELKLVKDEGKLCLTQKPIEEHACLRNKHWQMQNISVPASMPLDEINAQALEIRLTVCGNGDSVFKLKIHSGSKTSVIGFAFGSGELFVDRHGSGELALTDYQECYKAQLSPRRSIDLHILLDRSQLELFADQGRTVMTDLLFPEDEAYTLELCADAGDVLVEQADIYELSSIWDKETAYYNKIPFEPISGQWAHTVSGIEGYSKDVGISILPQFQVHTSWAARIKITNYEAGACAGLVLNAKEKLVAYLDGMQNKLILSGHGTILSACDTHINRNRVYKLGVLAEGNLLKILLDDVPCLEHSLPEALNAGLYVHNTFAYFIPEY